MELRAYWNIIWKRIWIVILIVAVVAIYVGYQYYHLTKTPGALKAYKSEVIIELALQSNTNSTSGTNTQGPTYADKITVSDTLAEAVVTSPILQSHEFDALISQQIGNDMDQIKQKFGPNPDLGNWQDTGAIGGALSTNRSHSIIAVDATWATPAGAWAIANAFGEVSTTHLCSYLNFVVSSDASCSSSGSTTQAVISSRVISQATDPGEVAGDSNNKPILLVLLLFVALIVGIALTFLADYLDDHIRNKDDAARVLQLPVYGTIPPSPEPTHASSSPARSPVSK